MRVLKFGGKSLSSPEKTQNICKYIQKIYKKEKNIVIVVSAIGNTTDKLIELAETYGNNFSSKSELAKLLSTGETQSSALFAIMLNSIGVPAKSLSAYELEIKTFGDPLDSKVAHINKSAIIKCFKSNTIAVVAGFQGINEFGEITTLGRGGSDTTAAAIAATLGCDAEIYSDFSGIFSGDPRLLNFKKIKAANYDIMIKMAKAGSKVLHHRSVEIAKKYGINIISKNSALPEMSGSIVSNIESDIVSISSISGLAKININFSNNQKLKFIAKNVLYSIKDVVFYNLIIKSDEIEFLIEEHKKIEILSFLSKKLNLTKK